MDLWLKSGREGHAGLRTGVFRDNNRVPGIPSPSSASPARAVEAVMFSLLLHLLSRPRLPEVRGPGLDLVAPQRMFTAFGESFGIYSAGDSSQPALCLIILGFSAFTGQMHQHTILFTPSQSHNQYN